MCFQVLGNTSEFQRITNLLEQTLDFDMDINVSVFETNIRGENLVDKLKLLLFSSTIHVVWTLLQKFSFLLKVSNVSLLLFNNNAPSENKFYF